MEHERGDDRDNAFSDDGLRDSTISRYAPFCKYFRAGIDINKALLGPQSRFGGKLLTIRVLCPRIWECGAKGVNIWYNGQPNQLAARGSWCLLYLVFPYESGVRFGAQIAHVFNYHRNRNVVLSGYNTRQFAKIECTRAVVALFGGLLCL